MKLSIVVQFDFIPGTDPKYPMAIPKITLEDGTVIETGDPIQVQIGNSILCGPIPLNLADGISFHTFPITPSPASAAGAAASQAKPSATAAPGRR